MHLEAIKIRDYHNKQLNQLKHTVRNLEVDKNYLEDHCYELVHKIHEMEQNSGKGQKGRDEVKISIHKKAFVSTVRSGIPSANSASQRYSSRRADGKQKDVVHVENLKLQNDIKAAKDETDALKKQVIRFLYQ